MSGNGQPSLPGGVSAVPAPGAAGHTSTQYGRVPLTVFLALWNAPGAVRYRYRPIRIVPVILSVVLGALWAYYLYSIIAGVGLTTPLVVFGLALLALSGWVFLRLMVWRLFVRRSGVVFTADVLAWRQGPVCFLAPWKLIDPEGLGLDRVAFQGGYDNYLGIQVGDTIEPLYLVRIYARIGDIEGFMGELLLRIPREKWQRASAGARKDGKKGDAARGARAGARDKDRKKKGE